MKIRTMITVGLLVLLLCIVGAIAGIYLFHSQEQQENPDVYAWISIPGTDIDAPVLQHSEDNSFYAAHDAEGEENPAGALYTENYNHTNFDDPLTVIYGNDNQDGSMFGGLYQYADDAYMKEHAWIYITFDNAEYKYKVFAAYKSDSRHIMERFNSGKEEANRKAYLESIMDNRTMGAQIDENAQVTADLKLLTLSTHDDSDPEGRFLVQAYLVEKEEKSN